MQPDTITLAVDVAHDANPENQDYRRSDEFLNRSVYIGESHSLSARDTLTLYRTQAKPTTSFKGVAKTSLKFSEDKLVTAPDGVGQITSPIICEVSFSLPVGVTAAAVLEMRQRAIAMLNSDAIMDDLNLLLLV